jgi:hypothetical protein
VSDDRGPARAADSGSMPVPGVPSDNTTMVDVVRDFERAGFDGDVVLHDDGTVGCGSCGATAAPQKLEVHHLRRLEGASDPGDMVAVVAIACPSCGQRGTLVIPYGPEGSAGEAEFLQHLQDERGRHDHPGRGGGSS